MDGVCGFPAGSGSWPSISKFKASGIRLSGGRPILGNGLCTCSSSGVSRRGVLDWASRREHHVGRLGASRQEGR